MVSHVLSACFVIVYPIQACFGYVLVYLIRIKAKSNDLLAFEEGISMAYNSVSSILSAKVGDANQGVKVETSPISILQDLTHLRCLNEANLLAKLGKNTCNVRDIENTFSYLEKVDENLLSTDFLYIEPIWAQRQVLLGNLLKSDVKLDIAGSPIKQHSLSYEEAQKTILKKCVNQCFKLCNLAVVKQNFHVAKNSLMQITHLIKQNKCLN